MKWYIHKGSLTLLPVSYHMCPKHTSQSILTVLYLVYKPVHLVRFNNLLAKLHQKAKLQWKTKTSIMSYKVMEVWSYNRNADTILTIVMWRQETVIVPIIKDLNCWCVSQNWFCDLFVTWFSATVSKCPWLHKWILKILCDFIYN